MILSDVDKRFLDRKDWLIALVLAFGVACWAMMFGIPCPHPDFWTNFAAAARIRPGQSMLDAFWLFPTGVVFDLLNVSKALSVCGIVGRVGLGVTCGGVYLCLRAFWYERLNYEAPELPTGFWNTRFGSFAGALIFSLCALTWKEAQFASPGFLATQLAIVSLLLWQRARHSSSLFCLSLAYALCGVMATARPIMLVAAVALIVCDTRARHLKQFMEMNGEDGEALMKADQREIAATGVSLFFGIMMGFAMCLASVYRFSIVPEANFWNLFDVWFGDWGRQLADMFVSLGVIGVFSFVAGTVAVVAVGRNMRMAPSGGAVLRNIFLMLLLITACGLGVRRMTGADGRKLNAIRQYVDMLVESCRSDVTWLFTDGAFDDLIRLEMRDRDVKTAVMSLVSTPTAEEAEAFRDYAPEPMDRDTFAAGGSEVLKYWAQERKDRLEQSAWLIGSDVVRKYDADAPICVSGGVLRYGKAAATNDVAAVEGEMTRLVSVVEQVALRSVSPLEHADGAILESFSQLLRRLTSLAEERQRGYEKADDAAQARSELEKVRYFNNLSASLNGDKARVQKVERVRPTENLVLTPQEGLDVALKRADYWLAMRFAQAVLAAHPTNALAHYAIGMAQLEVNGYQQAVWHFRETVRLEPKNAAAYARLAVAYLKQGQLEYAEEAAQHALELDTYSKEALEVLKLLEEPK